MAVVERAVIVEEWESKLLGLTMITWCDHLDKSRMTCSTRPHNIMICQFVSAPVFQYPMLRYTTSSGTVL